MSDNTEADKQGNSRRKFLTKSGFILGLCTLGSSAFLESCENFTAGALTTGITKTIDLSNYNGGPVLDDVFNKPLLNYEGRGATIPFSGVNYGIPVMIIHLRKSGKPDDFVCFSSMCTHDHCSGKKKIRTPIGKTGDNRQIVCSCHGSRFDAYQDAIPVAASDGTRGPAQKPLKKFDCTFDPATNVLTINF